MKAAASSDRSGGEKAGVRKEGSDGPIALGPSNHVSDLAVKLSESVAYLRQVLFGADQGKGSCLTQSLVPEIDVEQSLDLILRAAAEDVTWPHFPAFLYVTDGSRELVGFQAL